ncbi:MAG: putative hydrolase of the HAD superfamily [Cyclobacteriaceae bacterium]
MKHYTHLFFDLDHTLWDYENNARETLNELFIEFNMLRYFSRVDAFINVFHSVNFGLWDKYNRSEIGREDIREQRFAQVLEGRGKPDMVLTTSMSDFFIQQCPRKGQLIDGTRELLKAISHKYSINIITNGFTDTQNTKLISSDIDHFFDHVVTSESTGSRKPDSGIFDYALEISGAESEKSLMIGDNLQTDIAGAQDAGWDVVWYNHKGESKSDTKVDTIHHLSELMAMLSH